MRFGCRGASYREYMLTCLVSCVVAIVEQGESTVHDVKHERCNRGHQRLWGTIFKICHYLLYDIQRPSRWYLKFVITCCVHGRVCARGWGLLMGIFHGSLYPFIQCTEEWVYYTSLVYYHMISRRMEQNEIIHWMVLPSRSILYVLGMVN